MRRTLMLIVLSIAVLTAATGCLPDDVLLPAAGSYDMSAANLLLRTATSSGRSSLFVVKDNEIINDTGTGRGGATTRVDVSTAAEWLAAGAMMTLVEEQRIALDDTVATYIPEFGGDKAEITIRQLWSHTSGLPADDPALHDRALTMEECIRRIAERPLLHPPGTVVIASAVGIQVGARICELVSGMAWQEFFRTRIADPLGMTSTSFNLLGVSRSPAVGIATVSSATDYARFLAMLLNDGVHGGIRVLSEQAVAEMERDQSRGARILSSPFDVPSGAPGVTPRPGIGVWLDRSGTPGSTVVELVSASVTGFTAWLNRSQQTIGVFSLSKQTPPDSGLSTSVRQAVRSAIAAGPRFSDVPPDYWAFTAVTSMAARDILTAEPGHSFHPERTVTRAQFARALCSILLVQAERLSENPFTDVGRSHVDAGFIQAASTRGWLNGFADGTFRPDTAMTIGQVLVAVARARGWSERTTLPWAGIPADSWARRGIEACVAHGIISASDVSIVGSNGLDPAAPCKRAQLCVLLSRVAGAPVPPSVQ
ncbi:MAG: serine hydrolase [Caldisericota bacterium]|nr:serine hydrolase [Caldisericota bacterium]